jgi:hypothetical protein
MPRTTGKKRLAALLALAGLLTHLTACGTLLHPERRGQPSGRLDPVIVALDAVGLLLFFIPGVIAFAVDFSNGTIYLPDGGSADARPLPGGESVQTVRLSPAELTPERLESVVRERTGQSIRLEPGAYRAAALEEGEAVSPAVLKGDLQSRTAEAEVRFPEGRR